MISPASSPQALASTILLDSFRRDRARGVNDDVALGIRPAYLDLLAKLGNPHLKLPPVFHVAGTNGKGSVCAFLRSMLEAAGKRVHVYTSPHLVRFHERIRIAGKLIEEEELVELLTLCRAYSPDGGVTYFEAATGAAVAAFARHPADFTIVEVGLGGRLDATNVIPKPMASIITRISFDHRDYLGDTIDAIAREKAGIMREDVPCFAAAQPNDGALKVLQGAAKKIGAPLFVEDQEWRVKKTVNGFLYEERWVHNPFKSIVLPMPALLGEHQIHNAGLAMAAILGVRSSGFRIQKHEIAKGLQTVEWPARLQRLSSGTLAALVPEGSELWLDGGHNDSAGEVLASQAEAWKALDGLPLHLICGMLTTKHPKEFLTPLCPYVASLHTVAIPDEVTSFSADDLAKMARTFGFQQVKSANSVEEALQNLLSEAKMPTRILICGSLYLAGYILRKNSEV